MTGGSQPQNGGAQGAPAGPDANRNMPAATGAASAVAGYEAVRNSFNASNVYRPQWWRDHPETWVPAGWVAGAAWHPTPWGAIANFCGYGNAVPISYNYGVNVTAQNGTCLSTVRMSVRPAIIVCKLHRSPRQALRQRYRPPISGSPWVCMRWCAMNSSIRN